MACKDAIVFFDFFVHQMNVKILIGQIYTSELILCSPICVHSATQHNIHMNPYFLFAVIHLIHRPGLSLSNLAAQSAE